MTKKIRDKILNEGFKNGKSVIAMWSDTRTIYERKDGTFYIMVEGRRLTIERLPDGSFYLASHG